MTGERAHVKTTTLRLPGAALPRNLAVHTIWREHDAPESPARHRRGLSRRRLRWF